MNSKNQNIVKELKRENFLYKLEINKLQKAIEMIKNKSVDGDRSYLDDLSSDDNSLISDEENKYNYYDKSSVHTNLELENAKLKQNLHSLKKFYKRQEEELDQLHTTVDDISHRLYSVPSSLRKHYNGKKQINITINQTDSESESESENEIDYNYKLKTKSVPLKSKSRSTSYSSTSSSSINNRRRKSSTTTTTTAESSDYSTSDNSINSYDESEEESNNNNNNNVYIKSDSSSITSYDYKKYLSDINDTINKANEIYNKSKETLVKLKKQKKLINKEKKRNRNVIEDDVNRLFLNVNSIYNKSEIAEEEEEEEELTKMSKNNNKIGNIPNRRYSQVLKKAYRIANRYKPLYLGRKKKCITRTHCEECSRLLSLGIPLNQCGRCGGYGKSKYPEYI